MENELKLNNEIVTGLGQRLQYFVILFLVGTTLVPLAYSKSSSVSMTPDDAAAPVVPSGVWSLDNLKEVSEQLQPIRRLHVLGPLGSPSTLDRTHVSEPAEGFDVSFGRLPTTRQTQSEGKTSPVTRQSQKHVRTSPSEEPNREHVETSYNTQEAEKPRKRLTALQSVRGNLIQYIESQGSQLGRTFSSLAFPSLEAALLSLAFLTFAVFLIDLVQDLLSGTNSSGRRRRSRETEGDVDEGVTDLIVLTLSSLDTLSFGREHPDCGRKLLCHLNRSGWHHDGFLGTASNYLVSLLLAVLSPSSGFQQNLDAANVGRKDQDCIGRYPSCPSILGDLLPSAN